MNIVDRTISWFSPERGLARIKARARTEGLTNARLAYQGATAGRRAQGWRAVSTDANAETRGASMRLRDVARDMVRNNPHAARAVQVITHNVVGTGIIPTAALTTEKHRADLEVLLKAHFDTTACDADGRHDLYGLQALAMRTIVESGEAIVRKRPRRAEDGLPLPFQIQVMEPDHIDSSIDGPQPNGSIAVQGVEYNAVGKRIAYHLFQEHPGALSTYRMPQSVRVPAGFVAHIYRSDRPGQARGVSWFAPVVLRMRDFADFADAQLVRQKVAACFAAFIETEDSGAGLIGATTEGQSHPLEMLEPGIIERLRVGEKVSFGAPPQVAGYAEYMGATLHEIAAGIGVSYEALTGDLKGVNFSSGRMGWLEFQRSIDAWRNHMLMPQFCEPVSRWFLDAVAVGTGKRIPAQITWTAPRREMIDPTREIPAIRNAIRAGLSSRSFEQRRLGFDPHDIDAEIAADNARADASELIFDSDPRRVTIQGRMQDGFRPDTED